MVNVKLFPPALPVTVIVPVDAARPPQLSPFCCVFVTSEFENCQLTFVTAAVAGSLVMEQVADSPRRTVDGHVNPIVTAVVSVGSVPSPPELGPPPPSPPSGGSQ